eukprot:9767018-Prorocentrum_lima.AAC.1
MGIAAIPDAGIRPHKPIQVTLEGRLGQRFPSTILPGCPGDPGDFSWEDASDDKLGLWELWQSW